MKQAPAAPRLTGRQRGRRAAAAALLLLSGAMLVGAGWLGAYPYITNVQADSKQSALVTELEQTKTEITPSQYKAGAVKEGRALTRIRIPAIRVDTVVVEGTNETALRAGAGHYRESPLPGEPGNMAIAGHRTTHGRPFNRLDELKPGDKIILTTPFAQHTYEVIPAFDGHANPWVTTPNDWSVIAPTNEAMLTLTTCHPKGSARERLILRAKLVNSEPLS